jgi:hypothetical protein
MKRQLSILEMSSITGGDNVDNFCAGFGAVSSVYMVGVWANWWNPVGWSAGAAAVLIGGGCALYAIR